MANNQITREEFETLKDAVLQIKDILSKCNLKIPADFEDIYVGDSEENYSYDDTLEEGDSETETQELDL